MLGSPHARAATAAALPRTEPGSELAAHILASKRCRFCVSYRWTDAPSPTDTTLPSFMIVYRTDMTLPSFMTVSNSHEQVYIKVTLSLI